MRFAHLLTVVVSAGALGACAFDAGGVPLAGGEGDGGVVDGGEDDGGPTIDGGPLAAGAARLYVGVDSPPRLIAYTLEPGASEWSSEVRAVKLAASPRFVTADSSPDGAVQIVMVLEGPSQTATLEVFVDRGLGPALAWSLPLSMGTAAHARAMDVAFEQTSGDALLVWGDGTPRPRYMVAAGGIFGEEQPLPINDGATDITSANVLWAELDASQRDDEIALGYSTSNDELGVVLWDGGGWDTASAKEPATQLKYNGQTFLAENRPFDVCYEWNSGDLMVAWGEEFSYGFGAMQWDKSNRTWGSSELVTEALPDGNAFTLDVEAKPESSRLALGAFDVGDGIERLGTIEWDGSTWEDGIELDAVAREFNEAAYGRMPGAVGWIGNDAVAVYADDTAAAIDWAHWSSSPGWVLQPDVLVAQKGLTDGVAMRRIGDGQLLVLVDQGGAMFSARGDGTTWTVLSPMPLGPTVATLDGVPFALVGK